MHEIGTDKGPVENSRTSSRRSDPRRVTWYARRVRFVAFTALAFASLCASSARADADFEVSSEAWNGASTFLSAARSVATVETATDLDLDRLTEEDALFLLGPETRLPEDDLVEFVRRGGRLVVADDFGSGVSIFARFGIRVSEPGSTDAPRVRGQDALLVARPYYAHPITEGVGVVVTNRPLLLEHNRLVPLIALDDGGPGIVLTGVVGRGRVVAIGDPSIFLNAMMELSGNRRLAENVVRFVTEDRETRRIVVATGRFRVRGSFDPNDSGPIRERVERQLESLAATRMPDPALRVAGVLLALLSLVLLSTMREARREPIMPWLDSRTAFVGPDAARREALCAAIELAARRRLGVAGAATKRDVARAVRSLTLAKDDEGRILRALEGRGNETDLALASAALDRALARRGTPAETATHAANDRKEAR